MGVTVTDFGRRLRKLRIDRGETLAEMACHFDITSSYLSAIEKGKRPAPRELAARIAEYYDLDVKPRNELIAAAERTAKSVKIDLSNVSETKKDAALVFARSFNDLDDTTAASVIKLLRREGRD